MQKLFNINKWTVLKEGEALMFTNPKPRSVRVEVNAPVKSVLHYISDEGEVVFLALVEGRDTLEFGCTGAFQLAVEGAAVNVYTADGDSVHVEAVESASFTKLVERRRRNPELEQMMQTMYINMEKRFAHQNRELQMQLDNARAQQASNAVSEGGPVHAGEEPAPTGSGDVPGAVSAPDSSGEQQGETAA